MFVCDMNKVNKMYYYLAIIGIIIFSFYILYKTKVVIENAEKCQSPEDADYIKESHGLFLGLLNIFLRL
jgi:FtsH-binding integral membrane protein